MGGGGGGSVPMGGGHAMRTVWIQSDSGGSGHGRGGRLGA